ncbi:TldD/PmbA family protein [Microbulbifer thermotolerans]|uniref:Peptidase C69 n=1 Tax=Microbulbifer thermotolerans TaxID=252514 RepID=A0A143HHT1_MICTH|nr:TldD/PmbA family protein [Microbulbifer thermotolerans]AMX01278.1 peptidase C69 [Microbulbifer thermotolerans]MCX2830323.1 TldD/PmbA family protein [Microbulbifer thermotolerans]MCX2840308.1 TldD/PmbA family protein [Microbulbifer thermotolerans]
MAILSRSEAKQILDKVLKYSKAEAASAQLSGSETGNIRYARNSVSTSGIVNDIELVVEARFGKKSGIATINEFSDAALEKVMRRAEELAKLSPDNPESMPLLGAQKYLPVNAFAKSTAGITPDQRAKAAADSIAAAKKQKVVAAGFLEDTRTFAAVANTEGLFGYHASTSANFTVTMRTENGQGSGWAQSDVTDFATMDTGATSRIAAQKAVESQQARALEPGKYTVILEPSAVSGLLGFMMWSADARTADEGRSFMSKKGGGNRIGEKMFDKRVHLYSDPTDPNVPAQPWSDEDHMALSRIDWIKNGVVRNLPRSRYWAQKTKAEPVPRPSNLIMAGGDKSTEQLIKETRRGVLVTRTWYIRMVDPQSLLLTGLTRDGTFYIENGKIKYPIKNFRFNESPVIMLNNIEDMGRPQRVGMGGFSAMIPALKVRDFTFSSLSDAV